MNNLIKKHAKSFYWASFFLSKPVFDKCSSLYNFCRTLDDIVDDDKKLEIKKENFLKFKKDFLNKDYDNPIIKEMWSVIDEENISKHVVMDLFDGVQTDLEEKVKINSKKELLIYSYRVAGTVGLMMSKILKVRDKESLKGAVDLGIAMQLTNIARDVIEDSSKNRKYINSNFDSIKNTVTIADSFYKSSFSSISDIPINCRFAILVARRVYRQIGVNILKKRDFENYKKSGKIYVSNFEKLFQTILSIFDFFVLLTTNSKEHEKEAEHQIISEEINLNERI